MPIGNWQLQFGNLNQQRAYPLTDSCSKQDSSGTITIPNSFLVGLVFPINAGQDVDPSKVFLISLLIAPTTYTVSLGYDDGSPSPPTIASASVNAATHVEGFTYPMVGSGNFNDSQGFLGVGVLSEINLLPPGQYFFAPAAAMLEPDCIRPQIRGVSSITVVNGTDTSPPIANDIELISGTNMNITTNIVEGQVPQIILNAISGAGLNTNCECDTNTQTGPCIQTINGIQPLPNGDFRITGNKCLEISAIANGLSLTDICSDPCCGCQQLDALTTQVNSFANAKNSLETLANRLSAEVATMSLVVLGSRLGG